MRKNQLPPEAISPVTVSHRCADAELFYRAGRNILHRDAAIFM